MALDLFRYRVGKNGSRNPIIGLEPKLANVCLDDEAAKVHPSGMITAP